MLGILKIKTYVFTFMALKKNWQFSVYAVDKDAYQYLQNYFISK